MVGLRDANEYEILFLWALSLFNPVITTNDVGEYLTGCIVLPLIAKINYEL